MGRGRPNFVCMPTLAPIERTISALANKHRRNIIDLLATGPVETPALGGHFEMSKQALNKHLVVLEGAGLVERHLDGRVHQLRLRPEPLDAVGDWVAVIRCGWEASLDRLGALLESDEQ